MYILVYFIASWLGLRLVLGFPNPNPNPRF